MFPPFLLSVAVLSEKASCPTPAACSGVGTLPGLRDILSRSGSLRCFPCRGIPFRTVIHFSRCSSSMNYPKSTRNGLGAGVGIPIVKEHTVPVLTTTALPAYQSICLFSLCWCHAVKGTVRLALYGRQSSIWVLSHVFPPFFLSRSLRKGFLPHSCGVFRRWHAPRTSGHFVPKLARCGASPAGLFLFGRSFDFQGAVHR